MHSLSWIELFFSAFFEGISLALRTHKKPNLFPPSPLFKEPTRERLRDANKERLLNLKFRVFFFFYLGNFEATYFWSQEPFLAIAFIDGVAE